MYIVDTFRSLPTYGQIENGLHKVNANRKALLWYKGLSKEEKEAYEKEMFGHGEWWEGEGLCNRDIVKMYEKYASIK